MSSTLSPRNETIIGNIAPEDILLSQYRDKMQTQIAPIFIIDLCISVTDDEKLSWCCIIS
jgi:hypothetical protein